jgi:hypothetical protein
MSLTGLHADLAPLRARLVAHPVYRSLRTLEHVRAFQEHHVFAVWDFMSLLKALQRALTCVDLPWRPVGDPVARRLIHEIVTAEESDDDGRGGYVSHYELYRTSMRESGASTRGIDAVLARLERGEPVEDALADAPPAAAVFSRATFAIVRSGSLPRIAAAFTLGREDVIPDMFRELVRDLDARGGTRLSALVDYLERHVALDGERHAPMAARMLESVCGRDGAAWAEARQGAEAALRARIALWDALTHELGDALALHAGSVPAGVARS